MLIQICSASGGTGCTTIAAALATKLSAKHRVLAVDGNGDLHDILGIRPDQACIARVHPTLDVVGTDHVTLHPEIDGYDFVIVDRGCLPRLDGGAVVGIVTNCYLNLRRWASDDNHRHVDYFVFRDEPARALTKLDVQTVVGDLAITIPYDRAIHRCVDAGQIALRLPDVLERPIQQLASLLETRHANV